MSQMWDNFHEENFKNRFQSRRKKHHPNYLMCEIVVVSENTENTCFPCDGLRLHACVEISATKNVAKLTQFLMWRCWANYSQEFPVFPYLSLLWYQSSCDPDPRCGILIIKHIILSPSNIITLLKKYNLVSIKYNHTRHSQVFLIVSGSDPRTASNNFQLWRAQVDPKLPSCENVYKILCENVLIVRMFWLWECL